MKALAGPSSKLRELCQCPLIMQGTLEALTRLTKMPVLDNTQSAVISTETSEHMVAATLSFKSI